VGGGWGCGCGCEPSHPEATCVLALLGSRPFATG
jgi:hypothetical protein